MNYTRENILHLCRTQPEVATDLIMMLLERVDKLEARVQELESILRQDSQNSHKPPSSDGYRRHIHNGSPEKKKQSRGGQQGHEGTTLRKSTKADHVVVHAAKSCHHCGSSLKQLPVKGYEERQVFDLPSVKLEVTEHRAEVKHCPCCNKEVVAMFPEKITKAVQYGSVIKALAVYMMQHQLLPFERTAECLSDMFGCHISKGTLKNWRTEAYTGLVDAERQIKEQLQEASVVHADETGIFCENLLQWVHLASTEDYTHYGIDKKRGKEAMDAIGIIPKVQGILVHDFWESYGRYEHLRHAYCNAHIVRELRAVYELNHQKWAQELIDLLFRIKKKIGTSHMSKNVLRRSLKCYDSLIRRGLRTNRRVCGAPHQRGRTKQSKARNLLERLRDHRNEVLAWMFDPMVPFTNNLGERDLRMLKVKQKVSGTFRSQLGGIHFCRIYSYISTMKKQGVSILQALFSVFEGDPLSPIPQLR